MEKDKTNSAQIRAKSLANVLFDKSVDSETITKLMEIISKQVQKIIKAY